MKPELTTRLTPAKLIRSAVRLVRRQRSWRGQPLWSLVSELTAHGSTYSTEICRGLGFDPDHKIGEPLQEPRADAEAIAAVPALKDAHALVLYFNDDQGRDEAAAVLEQVFREQRLVRTVKL